MAYIIFRQYNKVPNIKEDDVIPSVFELPSLLTIFRHPRKNRSVSIGPQSEADAYETLAYREKRRRESISEIDGKPSTLRQAITKQEEFNGLQNSGISDVNRHGRIVKADSRSTPRMSKTKPYMNAGFKRSSSEDRRNYENEEREMFSKIEKPRVRYDVEVVTKLIVYTGEVLVTHYISLSV